MSQEFIDAATQGDVAMVKAMLHSDPSLACAKDQDGLPVILKALYYGRKEVVDELLATNIQLDIFEAAALGQTQRVRELIAQDPSLVNTYSVDGFMPLGLAVFFGRIETVNTLLDLGAEVNSASRESMKVTPLASASAARQNEIGRILIARGADVNARAVNDFTPLHNSAANGNLDFARLLIENGADLNARTTEGKTALDYAREYNRAEMIDLLTTIR